MAAKKGNGNGHGPKVGKDELLGLLRDIVAGVKKTHTDLDAFRADVGAFRAELDAFRTETRDELLDLRGQVMSTNERMDRLTDEVHELRTGLIDTRDDVTKLRGEVGEVRDDVTKLRGELRAGALLDG